MPQLSRREQQLYRDGGFRLEGRRLSAAAAARARLHAAARILRIWGAGPQATRATLALPSASALRGWRRGRTAIPLATEERVGVVIALYRRLLAGVEAPAVQPLPALKRPGRPDLCARDLLAGGRLSDLLGLWRQLVRTEEAARRTTQRSRAKPRQRRRS